MNVINFEQQRHNILKNRYASRIRQMDDYYEYCIIPDYEITLDYDCIDRLPISGVIVQLAKVWREYHLVSVAIGQEYGLDALLEFLFNHQVSFFPSPQGYYQIDKASNVFESLYFEGCAIIHSSKGQSTIMVDDYELEDVFEETPERGSFLFMNSYSEVDWSTLAQNDED